MNQKCFCKVFKRRLSVVGRVLNHIFPFNNFLSIVFVQSFSSKLPGCLLDDLSNNGLTEEIAEGN